MGVEFPDDHDIIVRRLGAGENASMRALNELFGRVFDERETYSGAPPDEAWLERWLGRPDHIALVADVDGNPVGGLVAYELVKFEQARCEIYIYDLAIDEAWRRRGLATALIERVQAIAAQVGAWVVYVQADYVDAPAVALYEKLGVREEVLHFDLAPKR